MPLKELMEHSLTDESSIKTDESMPGSNSSDSSCRKSSGSDSESQ